MDSNPLCLLYRPTRARTKKLSGSLPKGEILLCHIFSSHFVTPHDTSCDLLLCLLFCSSPFPRPSAFPHHIPFVFVCLPCLPIPLFIFPFRPVALLPTLAAPFILRVLVTWLHFRVTVDTILPHFSVTVYKGLLLLLCSLVCNFVLTS